MSRKALFIVLALLAVGIAGCGGGSGSADSASSGGKVSEEAGLTKAVFIKQSDARCTKGNKRREASAEAYGKKEHLGPKKPLNQARMASLISVVVLPEITEEAENLASQPVPEGDGPQIEEIVAALEGAVAEAEQEPLRLLNSKESPFTEATKMSRAYGFKVCGQF